MNESPNTERSYIAFISYRHTPLDREAAERVQKKIERYVVPKEFREQVGGDKLGLCFRDEDELPASSSLTDSIYYALDHSKFLIVICTPNLPLSKWCEAEIKYFLKTHDRDHILAVLADGDPSESFSPYMLHDFDENGNVLKDWEPLAANIAGADHKIDNKAFKKEIVRIYAALIGCPFDALWQREKRARTNRLLSLAGAAVAVLAIFLGVVLNRNARIEEQNALIQAANEQITTQNNELIEKNDEIQKQNEQITEQNVQIEDQNIKLQKQLSTALVDSGQAKLDSYDRKGALADALSAVEGSDPAVWDPRAEKLLTNTLGAYQNLNIQCSIVYEQTTDITGLSVTDDEEYALLLDSVGVIRCLDLSDYSVCWEVPTMDPNTKIYTKHQENQILYKSQTGLYCLSVEDGSLLWAYEHSQSRENYFQAMSDDGTIFAVLDRAGKYDYSDEEAVNPLLLLFLDTKTGAEISRVELKIKEGCLIRRLTLQEFEYGAAFSKDNRLFIAAVRAEVEGAESFNLSYETVFYRVDLTTQECKLVSSLSTYVDKFYGFDIDSSEESIFYAAYVPRLAAIYTDLWTRGEETFYDSKSDKAAHAISSIGGFNSVDDDYRINDCPYISDENTAYIFSDNMLFIYDWKTNKSKQVYALSGKVINARWLDQENGLMEVICDDGQFIKYRFGKTGNTVLIDLFSESGGADKLIKACSIHDGFLHNWKEGAALAVSGNDPGKLLYMKRTADPHGVLIDLNPEDYQYRDRFLSTPGIETAFLIYNGNNVLSFDKNTGEIIKTAKYEDYLGWDNVIQISEDSFLMEENKYGLDGTVEQYAEPVGDVFYRGKEGDLVSEIFPSVNVRLLDGSILSYNSFGRSVDLEIKDKTDYEFSVNDRFEVFPIWQNGSVITETDDPKTGLLCYCDNNADESSPLIEVGKNGVVMVYGTPAFFDGKELTHEDSSAFRFYNVSDGKTVTIENRYPDSGEFKTAMGSEKPKMAAVYADGSVCIYDAADGSVLIPEKTYSVGEITAFCFDNKDEYLLLMNNTGELDIYDAETMELLFNEPVDQFRSLLRGEGRSLWQLLADQTADGSSLFIQASGSRSWGIFMDRTTWHVTASLDETYYYDADTDQVFKPASVYGNVYPDFKNSMLLAFPKYTIQDLKEWAEEELLEQGT